MNTQPEALRLADGIAVLTKKFSEGWHEGIKIDATDIADLCDTAAELRRLHNYESACEIWSEKTNWVQDSSQSHELGKHRADVLKDRIDRLHEVNQDLVEALEECLGWHDFSNDMHKPIEVRAAYMRAREIITKARGTE